MKSTCGKHRKLHSKGEGQFVIKMKVENESVPMRWKKENATALNTSSIQKAGSSEFSPPPSIFP